MRRRRVVRVGAALAVASAALVLGACGAGAVSMPKVATSEARASAPGDHTIQLTVQGHVRTLILHVPVKTVANRPLILVYHGALGTAAATEQSTDFESVSESTGDLVAYMQGYDNTWNEGAGHTPAEQAHINDVAFTSAAITKLESLIAFDHKRVVATGFSNGALMVEDLGCHLAARLALIVPVEGELPVSVSKTCAPAHTITVYEIHGTADASIPYGGGPFPGVGGGTTVLSAPASVARWASLDGCRPTPAVTYPSSSIKLTTYSGCRNKVVVTLRTIIGGTHEWGSNIGQIVANHVPA